MLISSKNNSCIHGVSWYHVHVMQNDNDTTTLTPAYLNQNNWPIEQVTDTEVLRYRAKVSEKKLAQLSNEYRENTYDKLDVHCTGIIILLALLAGVCFSMAFKSYGWDSYWLAGFLTAGITVPACVLGTIVVLRWRESREVNN